MCASCHGPTGAGDGPAAVALDPKPAKHDDGNYMNPLTDAYLTQVITEGGLAVGKSPLMAPWGGALDPEEVRDVIAFIRSLAVPAYTP
jgi:mono/diheme cytochrome c family protein